MKSPKNQGKTKDYADTSWLYTKIGQLQMELDFLNKKTRMMMGKGRAIDNVFIERFWRSYKYENRYLNAPGNGKELYE